jgi:hypothetical protein
MHRQTRPPNGKRRLSIPWTLSVGWKFDWALFPGSNGLRLLRMEIVTSRREKTC